MSENILTDYDLKKSIVNTLCFHIEQQTNEDGRIKHGVVKEVLQRHKFKKYFSSAAIEQLLALLYEKIAWVNVVDEFTDCRDKKDNFLLNLSVSGQANYLIRRCRFAGVKSLSWCKNCFLSVFSKCDFG